MYHPVLRPGAQRQLKKIGNADLVIRLPTHKNPQSAAHVARMALLGADQYYPHLKTVLVNADLGLEAATRQAIETQVALNGHTNAVVTGRYDGMAGPGSAIATLLDAALALDARAIIILDSNTQTITPNWMAGLAHLILANKVDLVLPRYHWSPLAPGSALSDLVVYPLFRALWGQSVRNPAAFDFAVSPQLATALLDQDIWETDAAMYGLPPWLTTYAVVNRWRVAQAALGEKKTALVPLETLGKQQTKKLIAYTKDLFHDVMSVMFQMIFRYRTYWQSVNNFGSISTLTQFATEVKTEPSLSKDPAPFLDQLALGWIEYRALWQRILTPDNLTQLEALATLPPDLFYFPPDLWARIIYDFAVNFNQGEDDPYQIVNALYPIYQGRLAAFWQEIAGLSFVAREGTIAAQAVEFEETRAYLKRRWQKFGI